MKPPCLATVQAMPCLCVFYPGIRLKTEEKSREKTCQGSRKVPVGHNSVCRHGHLLAGSHDKFVDYGLSWDA